MAEGQLALEAAVPRDRAWCGPSHDTNPTKLSFEISSDVAGIQRRPADVPESSSGSSSWVDAGGAVSPVIPVSHSVV
jgi:hypothetical protein